jgi:PAS domain S-box-containing protein
VTAPIDLAGGPRPVPTRPRQAADVISVLDADGIIRYVSGSVARVLGHQPDEIVGLDLLDTVHEDDQAALIGALASPESDGPVELRARHRDGSWRRLAVSIINDIDDPVERGFVLASRLVTEHVPADAPPAAGPSGRITAFPASAAVQAARLALEHELWRAIDRRELFLVYQPTVNLKSGTLAGVEALCRWRHPAHGLLLPTEFIPIAEESGAIAPLGRWVAEEACRQLRRWQSRFPYLQNLVISVNVSPREVQRPDFVEQIAAVLRDTGLSPARLTLEITESVVIGNAETALHTLHALRRMGVTLALDDFGTGYSSLSYLRRFPVDTLKIDQSFVQELSSNASSVAIVRALIALAHALGMNVTGEGFETAAQLARLRDAYCDHGQGFYFSRPLPADGMDDLLASLPA